MDYIARKHSTIYTIFCEVISFVNFYWICFYMSSKILGGGERGGGGSQQPEHMTMDHGIGSAEEDEKCRLENGEGRVVCYSTGMVCVGSTSSEEVLLSGNTTPMKLEKLHFSELEQLSLSGSRLLAFSPLVLAPAPGDSAAALMSTVTQWSWGLMTRGSCAQDEGAVTCKSAYFPSFSMLCWVPSQWTKWRSRNDLRSVPTDLLRRIDVSGGFRLLNLKLLFWLTSSSRATDILTFSSALTLVVMAATRLPSAKHKESIFQFPSPAMKHIVDADLCSNMDLFSEIVHPKLLSLNKGKLFLPVALSNHALNVFLRFTPYVSKASNSSDLHRNGQQKEVGCLKP